MPLPDSKAGAWPPKDVKPYLDDANRSTSWWTGNKTDLQAWAPAGDGNRRSFWGRRKTKEATKATQHLHAPVAADIAAVSADLLFGDPVGLTTTNEPVQDVIEDLEEKLGLGNLLLEAAETAAATGGAYLRPAWDKRYFEHPVMQVIPHTQAVPDWRYGHLVAVTLWETVYEDGTEVWRHLERHESGVILHGLYKGTKTDLGVSANLQAHPSTADLKPQVTLTGGLAGRLLPAYIPNMRPNRVGPRPFGRSDWQGAEDILDAIDETWTSLMRDIRLGQAHVMVPQTWLVAAGGRPGGTLQIDVDQELFTGLNMPDAEGGRMETYQAELRVTDHINALDKQVETLVSACGYSPQTFGLHIDGNASSGTALRIRENKTTRTRNRKRRYAQTPIRHAIDSLLLISADQYSTPAPSEPVKVTWSEVERDPSEKAQFIADLRAAKAMSIHTAVATAQPDLDETEVDDEVDRIQAEDQITAPFDLP